jgi:hypothetical protein
MIVMCYTLLFFFSTLRNGGSSVNDRTAVLSLEYETDILAMDYHVKSLLFWVLLIDSYCLKYWLKQVTMWLFVMKDWKTSKTIY